jgi:formylglycine-generating enzyme
MKGVGMLKKVVVAISVFCCLNAYAVNVSVKGKITKGGADPVAGARISLKNHPLIFAFSGSDGTYNLSGNTRALVSPWIPGSGGIAVRSMPHGNGIIVRTGIGYSDARVDIYKVSGRLLASKRLDGVHAVEHVVPFVSSASEALIVKISSSSGTRTFKAVPGIGIAFTLSSGATVATMADSRLNKTAASISDSVFVYSQGNHSAVQALPAYEKTGVDFSLTASNPWVPTEALVRDKGMVKIMAKTYDFEMGQPVDTMWGIDATGYHTSSNEQPVHTVTFANNFWLDTTEVTQADYDSLMKKYYSSYHTPLWDATHGIGPKIPANVVNWSSAALYCNARSKNEGLTDTVYAYNSISGLVGAEACKLVKVTVNTSSKAYRLPTEAEWEYAGKGGTFTDYYWGKNYSDYLSATVLTDVNDYAIWAKNSKVNGTGNPGYGLHAIATTKPNKYGLYDMIGNATEWCHDDFSDYVWGQVTDSVSPVKTDFHPQRGGNWGNEISYLRSQCRAFDGSADYYTFFQGFRVARTAAD